MTVTQRPTPKLRPDQLDADQRALYDQITGGPRGQGPQHFSLVDDEGALEGPFNGFLLQPAVGSAMQSVGAALRFQTDLSDRLREIAILAVAAAQQSEFEQFTHERIGRAVGLDDVELAAIRSSDISENAWPNAHDLLVAQATHALATAGDLDDELYSRVVSEFGTAGLMELTSIVGYYAALALQLRVLRVEPPTT